MRTPDRDHDADRERPRRAPTWAQMFSAGLLGGLTAAIVLAAAAWSLGYLTSQSSGERREPGGVMQDAPGPDNRITSMPELDRK